MLPHTKQKQKQQCIFQQYLLRKLKGAVDIGLTKLKPAKRHEAQLEQKRQPTYIPTSSRKSSVPKKIKFKSIKPIDRVNEFPDELFRADPNSIFCLASHEELSLKVGRIKDHTKTAKHQLGKVMLE